MKKWDFKNKKNLKNSKVKKLNKKNKKSCRIKSYMMKAIDYLNY